MKKCFYETNMTRAFNNLSNSDYVSASGPLSYYWGSNEVPVPPNFLRTHSRSVMAYYNNYLRSDFHKGCYDHFDFIQFLSGLDERGISFGKYPPILVSDDVARYRNFALSDIGRFVSYL